MVAVQLTEGAIPLMMSESADADNSNFKPVLQVSDIRVVITQNQSSERYTILLSDGEFTYRGVLATERNELVKSNYLQKGSVIILTHFVSTVVQNRNVIIIIDVDVIVEKCDPIGLPKEYPIKVYGTTPTIAKSSTPTQLMNLPTMGA